MVDIAAWVRNVECFSEFAEVGQWKPDWTMVLPAYDVRETISGEYVAFRKG